MNHPPSPSASSSSLPPQDGQEMRSLELSFEKKLNALSRKSDLGALRAEFLGKKGALNGLSQKMKTLSSPEEKRALGQIINSLKQNWSRALEDKERALETAAFEKEFSRNRRDISLRDSLKADSPYHGGLHPVSLVRRELEDIFLSMGFTVLDGPHIEDDYHNFEALNIPPDHPARDMQDTFWFADLNHLLRTHTSPIQIRGMEKHRPPFRFVSPGKVFRCEAVDASHEAVFHQMEGMMVGKEINVANLIYFMKTLLKEIFRKEMKIRLRPGFFPFVEPGFELDIHCLICDGAGCSVCKKTGWLELLPCGMVHPNVLRAGDIDPHEYSGFAFGLGLDRLVMMRYGINDIRHLLSGQLDFVSQFNSY